MNDTEQQSNEMKRWHGMWLGSALVVVALLAGAFILDRQTVAAADMIVYKSPTCGCCGKWVEHMRANGFSVEVHERFDLQPIKARLGVPRAMQSCHTAKIGGYVIEGHVPADVVARLLREKPAVKGLAVPGMPMGSPGMEGPRKDAYDILALGENANVRVYASR